MEIAKEIMEKTNKKRKHKKSWNRNFIKKYRIFLKSVIKYNTQKQICTDSILLMPATKQEIKNVIESTII